MKGSGVIGRGFSLGLGAAAAMISIGLLAGSARAGDGCRYLCQNGGNGALAGMYAFSFSGYNTMPFVVAGSLTFDGQGHVTGGEYDINEPVSEGGPQHYTVTGGNYLVGPNGLTPVSFSDSGGNKVQLLVATGNSEEMQVISANTGSNHGFWGAGVFRQQDPSAFNEAAGAGNWAFGFQGFDSTTAPEPLAGDGNYSENASGSLTNGNEDVNDFGTHLQATFTGMLTSSPPVDGNGRATVQFQVSDGIGTVNSASYVVSANELLSIRIDSGSSLYVTDAFRQNGTFGSSSLSGNAVGGSSRQHNAGSNPNSQANVLLLESSDGDLTATVYSNTAGVVSNESLSGTYTVASNGRAALTFSDGSEEVCYLIATNQGFCINAIPQSGSNAKGAEVFYFEPQSGGPFGLESLSRAYAGGSLPQYISSIASSVDSMLTDGAGNFSYAGSESGPAGIQPQSGSGTYTVNATTGLITMSSNDSAFAYGYVVSPDKFDLISADDVPRTLIHVRPNGP